MELRNHSEKDPNAADARILNEFKSLKKLLLEGNANFIFAEKEQNGPNLYLLGISKLNGFFGEQDKLSAKKYFRNAAKHGHLPSKILLWRAEDNIFLKILYLLCLPYNSIKFIYIARNCPEDIRVLC